MTRKQKFIAFITALLPILFAIAYISGKHGHDMACKKDPATISFLYGDCKKK